MTDPVKVLSDDEVQHVWANNKIRELIISPEIDALCATVRVLQRRIEHFETPYGEGVCRFCGNLRQAPQGHIQKCYCIPTIRQYIAENTALREQLAQSQAENERLALQLRERQEEKDTKAGYL